MYTWTCIPVSKRLIRIQPLYPSSKTRLANGMHPCKPTYITSWGSSVLHNGLVLFQLLAQTFVGTLQVLGFQPTAALGTSRPRDQCLTPFLVSGSWRPWILDGLGRISWDSLGELSGLKCVCIHGFLSLMIQYPHLLCLYQLLLCGPSSGQNQCGSKALTALNTHVPYGKYT
jgi:hypothetical protein